MFFRTCWFVKKLNRCCFWFKTFKNWFVIHDCESHNSIPVMSKLFFVQIQRCWRSSKFLLREYAFIRNKDRDLFLLGIPTLYISSISQYLEEQIFLGSLLFSGFTLLNWFTESSKFGVGFKINELISAGSFVPSTAFVQQVKKFLSHDKKLKGKTLLQHSM